LTNKSSHAIYCSSNHNERIHPLLDDTPEAGSMSMMITKASMKRRLRNIDAAAQDVAKVRRAALASIKAAKALPPGQLRLVREDWCGSYDMARAMLKSARGQIVNVEVLN
jgi:hypothetical protein